MRLLNQILCTQKVAAINEPWRKKCFFFSCKLELKVENAKSSSNATRHTLEMLVAIILLKLWKYATARPPSACRMEWFLCPKITFRPFLMPVCSLSMQQDIYLIFSITNKSKMTLNCSKHLLMSLIYSYTQTQTKLFTPTCSVTKI